jgi:glutamate dehydrogenase (NAD(P)+)
MRARIVAEGANGPTTVDADDILAQKGCQVVPDILASAGGVTVSYFEWVQGLQFFFWSEDEINARLKQVMDRACDVMFAVADESGLSLRMAALTFAMRRVYDATLIRGIYP